MRREPPGGTTTQVRRFARRGGIPSDASGRFLDVHALRHCTGTRLDKAGVAPRTAMALMRHSKIERHRKSGHISGEMETAGDGARTRMAGLEGRGSTIELRPHVAPDTPAAGAHDSVRKRRRDVNLGVFFVTGTMGQPFPIRARTLSMAAGCAGWDRCG